jgi:hypothetical protein
LIEVVADDLTFPVQPASLNQRSAILGWIPGLEEVSRLSTGVRTGSASQQPEEGSHQAVVDAGQQIEADQHGDVAGTHMDESPWPCGGAKDCVSGGLHT